MHARNDIISIKCKSYHMSEAKVFVQNGNSFCALKITAYKKESVE